MPRPSRQLAENYRNRWPRRPRIALRRSLPVRDVQQGQFNWSSFGPDLLMPAPDFVLCKPTAGLYFTGLPRWDEAFTRDLGNLFEAYVGRQLGLVPGATLQPEIQYGRGGDKSIDWFLVFPDFAVLVEAQLARPTRSSDPAQPERRRPAGSVQQRPPAVG